MEFKYIMLVADTGRSSLYLPIIFPKHLTHRDTAEVMKTSRDFWPMAHNAPEVRSAGFVSFAKLSPVCFGESETLGVKSHKDDSNIIATYNYAHGLCEKSHEV